MPDMLEEHPATMDLAYEPRPLPQKTRRMAPAQTAGSIGLHLLLIVLAVLSLIPFAWLICATFKSNEDFFAYTFLPWHHLDRLTTSNYHELFIRQPFARWMLNSI